MKRARTSSGQSLPRDEYLQQLSLEKEKLQSLDDIPHTLAWIESEIERVTHDKPIIGADSSPTPIKSILPWERQDDSTEIRTVLVSNDDLGTNVRSVMKIFVPMMAPMSTVQRPQTTRGLLLGPGGSKLKALATESRCTVKLRGKGSDAKQETAEDGEELHVISEYIGAPAGRDMALTYIDDMVRCLMAGGQLTPMPRPDAFLSASGLAPVAGAGEALVMRSAEQAFVGQMVAEGHVVSLVADLREVGGRSHAVVKVFIPKLCSSGCSRGKLLGNRGSFLRALSAECGCKLYIRGRGSTQLKPGETEEKLMVTSPALHGHLKVMRWHRKKQTCGGGRQEDLHVVVEYDGPSALKDRAEALIKSSLFPERFADLMAYGALDPTLFAQPTHPNYQLAAMGGGMGGGGAAAMGHGWPAAPAPPSMTAGPAPPAAFNIPPGTQWVGAGGGFGGGGGREGAGMAANYF